MMDTDFLYIIPCSNHKVIQENANPYDSRTGPAGYLTQKAADNFIQSRGLALEYIQDGSFSRTGLELRNLPYNRQLQNGPDFGGRQAGQYLPACQRYIGRLYRELNSNAWQERRHRVLILSGLYGLLTPEEPIQCYSLHADDSQLIAQIWQGELTKVLMEYIQKYNLGTVVDLTAENAYRSLIDWDQLRAQTKVLHALGEQNTGPSLLESLGSFLRHKGFQADSSELHTILNHNCRYLSEYETIYFVEDIAMASSMGLPVETADEQDILKDAGVPAQEKPAELASLSNIETIFSYRVLQQFAELPKNIKSKVPSTLTRLSKNPDHPGLRLEKISNANETFYRCRIDQKYRIHLNFSGSDPVKLTIRAIGGHRLEGIG